MGKPGSREPMIMNLGHKTLLVKFEDVSAAEATIYASELRDIFLGSVPGAKLDQIADTPLPQDFGTPLVLLVERSSLAAFNNALGNWLQPFQLLTRLVIRLVILGTSSLEVVSCVPPLMIGAMIESRLATSEADILWPGWAGSGKKIMKQGGNSYGESCPFRFAQSRNGELECVAKKPPAYPTRS